MVGRDDHPAGTVGEPDTDRGEQSPVGRRQGRESSRMRGADGVVHPGPRSRPGAGDVGTVEDLDRDVTGVAVAGQDAWKAQADRTAEIPTATPADMEWANAYLFSAPTRYGLMASQMRAFIDTLGGVWFQGKLANKAISAMTSAQNAHGGQEATILSFYTTAFHWGAVVVAPGYTDPSIYKVGGNPYGYSHTQGTEFGDDVKAAIGHQARRLVEFAAKLA